VFDLLSLNGRDLTGAPYSERRAELEALNLNGVYWQTPETFTDGPALVRGGLCARTRRCRRETPQRALPPGATWMGEDQEPRLLALRHGARVGDQPAAGAHIRLTRPALPSRPLWTLIERLIRAML